MGASARDFYCHTGGGGWTGGSRGALLVWVLLVVNKMEKQEKTGKTSPFKLLLPGCSKTRRHSYTPGG